MVPQRGLQSSEKRRRTVRLHISGTRNNTGCVLLGACARSTGAYTVETHGLRGFTISLTSLRHGQGRYCSRR